MVIFYVIWKLVRRTRWVDIRTVDLHRDEHVDGAEDTDDDKAREKRLSTSWPKRWLWKAYYLFA